MSYASLAYRLPRPLRRHILHFEEELADAVAALAKDLAYLALVAAALPFTLAEAAFGAGSTVMVEARRL